MRLTTWTETETTLDRLIDRLYPNLTSLDRQQATNDLLKANPQLGAGQRPRPGLVIQVPSRSNQKTKAAGLTDDPVDEVRATLEKAVSAYEDLAAKRASQESADLALQGGLLKRKDIASAVKAGRGAPELAKDLVIALRTRGKELEVDRNVRAETFARIRKDLDALLG